MKKKILLIRPRAASERWAALLTQRGFSCVIEPLLMIEPTYAPAPKGSFQAVLITSANVLDVLNKDKQKIATLLSLPCFCVGSATAAAAVDAGFTDVRPGASNGAALAERAVAELKDKVKPLLHIAGDVVNDEAQAIMVENGFHLTSWTVYRAVGREDFTPETRSCFAQDGLGAIPVFSPRSARLLVAAIEKNGLEGACRNIVAIGFSQAVADMLRIIPWRRLRVAAKPSEEEVLAILQSESL